MTDSIVINPLGLVLIFTAHMVFTRPNQTVVIGTLGKNITLQFTFSNTNVRNNSHFAVYTKGEKKIAEHLRNSIGNRPGVRFNIYPHNNSVLYHITNLTLNQSGTYWATLFDHSIKNSNELNLTVLNETRSSTVPPKPIITTSQGSGNSTLSDSGTVLVKVLVASPVLLLVVLLLASLIWCLVRTSDKQQQGPQRNSNPTIQETVEVSNDVAPPSVIYSVLDFPKRPSAVLEFNPNDTEYAAVSYLQEKRRVVHS